MNSKSPKKAILLAAYGASNFQSQESLRAFETICRAKFPGIPVRWAFTSITIIERLARRRQKSDSLRKALLKLYFEKFEQVAIQPLQTIPGREYEDVLENVRSICRDSGLFCMVGAPLLNAEEELGLVAQKLLENLPTQRAPLEDIVFMGHGAKHKAVKFYEKLGDELAKIDKRVHIGTMEGKNILDEILPRLQSGKVWLLPLLSLVGKHAIEDMAGQSSQSWKSRIENSGHECEPVLKGMAEYGDLAEIWLDHLRLAAGAMLQN